MPETLCELLDRACADHPDRIAIECQGDKLTYAETLSRADQLAHRLVREGVRPGDRVGVLMAQGVLSLVALHGVLRAGAAYVPLDPNAPTERLAFCVAECSLAVVVTDGRQKAVVETLTSLSPTLQAVIGETRLAAIRGAGWAELMDEPVEPFVSLPRSDSCAYIIFTSGSTGAPKGVTHTHASSLAFVEWALACYDLQPSDRFANQAALHFDMSIFDLFAANAAGATIVVVPQAYTRFPASHIKLLADHQVTVLFTVPYVLSGMLASGVLDEVALPSLRWVIFGGDGHVVGDINRLIRRWPSAQFSHMYGPAETNGCTFQILSGQQPEDQPIHIGQAAPGMQCRVADDALNEVAAGDTGELLIAGPSLMSGYWNQPEQSEQVLVQPDGKQVFYRSGDYVCRLPDGNLRFLGRRDRMVKVRGNRVELDEIEAGLSAHPAVREAGVVTVPDATGSVEIVAAVLTATNVETKALESHLAQRVPAYARPSRIEVLETFPRTGTGKLDRMALQALLSSAPR